MLRRGSVISNLSSGVVQSHFKAPLSGKDHCEETAPSAL
jgi:hypothetical protein